MPSSNASEISICNQALGLTGGKSIISFDDPQTEAKLSAQLYPLMRDAVLEQAEWSFAIARDKLAKLSDAPDIAGYGVAHQLPSECIRALTAHPNNSFSQEDQLSWFLEQRKILTNSESVYLRYIKRIINVSEYSPSFITVLVYRLASEFAVPLSRSTKLQENWYRIYEQRLDEAMGLDGMQGSTRRLTSSWSHRSRY